MTRRSLTGLRLKQLAQPTAMEALEQFFLPVGSRQCGGRILVLHKGQQSRRLGARGLLSVFAFFATTGSVGRRGHFVAARGQDGAAVRAARGANAKCRTFFGSLERRGHDGLQLTNNVRGPAFRGRGAVENEAVAVLGDHESKIRGQRVGRRRWEHGDHLVGVAVVTIIGIGHLMLRFAPGTAGLVAFIEPDDRAYEMHSGPAGAKTKAHAEAVATVGRLALGLAAGDHREGGEHRSFFVARRLVRLSSALTLRGAASVALAAVGFAARGLPVAAAVFAAIARAGSRLAGGTSSARARAA